MNAPGKIYADLRYLKGVGPKRSLIFQKIGIRNVRDLLYLFPRRYEDRSRFLPLDKIPLGEAVTCRGEILDVKFKPIRGMPILEVLIGDATGTLRAVWFNQPYLRKQFEDAREIILYGKKEDYKGRVQMANPEFERVEDPEEGSIHIGRITPVYPLTEGLFQRSLRGVLAQAVGQYLDEEISDSLLPAIRDGLGLMPLDQAVREMHFPSSWEMLDRARRRIVFDEFFSFELQLFLKVKVLKTQYRAPAFEVSPALFEEFQRSLPFALTQSQEQALSDIRAGLTGTIPMNRLLQGDVGSGKTVVAAFAFLMGHRSNLQCAFLIPTEILAEQHFRTLRTFLEPLNVPVELLTKSTPADRRDRTLAELRQGKLSVIVGTHALLQDDVKFRSLGLVVVDEQHKFGVHQRNQLLQRTPRPHQLVMTATPIPRTLALTLYADLDISTMKEMPKGRRPIKTWWITRKKQPEVFDHMRKRLRDGEQAYIVFPLIEETEKTDLLAAKKEYERLKKTVFPEFKLGLVHGKVEREEREALMRAFARGEIRILVATSVIEVGVDQPNATMMIIENAERFGLAQLHQLRGRIGRGTLDSECFLFGEPSTEEGKIRLRLLTKIQDGFRIADEDMKLRGPGDLWGTRQSGEPLFRVAHPVLDEAVLLLARQEAEKVVSVLGAADVKHPPEWIQKYLEQMPKTD
ncbi:MAG TPA: ATP-dependent DNA helicase RecG [Candidatus Omnitrophota bacterium]|nr:ATP-dependent DNA helicase RecG [Candidatus Omnitrophota bacterium]HPS37488.1 ATP-dependent DNA helicase RecG [Candidatus Omnitrophota bacterium]